MATDRNTTPSPPNKSKLLSTVEDLQSFDIFSSPIPRSALDRIIRNLGKFTLCYAGFIWAVLFFVLVLNRKVSFVYLIATTQIIMIYVILMRVIPDLVVLHNAINRRFVGFLALVLVFFLVVITALVLIQAQGEMFLLASLVVTMGVIILHALLSDIEDDLADGFGEKSEDLV